MSNETDKFSKEKLETFKSQIFGIEKLYEFIDNLDKNQQIDNLLGPAKNSKKSSNLSKDKPQATNNSSKEPMKLVYFTTLLNTIAEQSLAKDQLKFLELASFRNLFMSEQATELLKQFKFSRYKLQALKIIRHRLSDPENYFLLLNAFEKSFEKKKASILLKNEENNVDV
ncbi:MAG: DUF4476 domain-containing protein [Thiomargarita sp.]|nr:DUF4476 domain-containing protein [Thiomargarita sp.]